MNWNIVDFKPAHPGWRSIHIDKTETAGWYATPLAGWLIMANRHGDRQVEAAIADGGEVSPVIDDSNFWQVLGPGEPDPTSEQLSQKLALDHPRMTTAHS